MAIGSPEFPLGNLNFFKQLPNLPDHPAFIEKAWLHPDSLNFCFLEKIIDVPEKSLIFPQMALEPFFKALLSPSHVKIKTGLKMVFRQFSRFERLPSLQSQHEHIET